MGTVSPIIIPDSHQGQGSRIHSIIFSSPLEVDAGGGGHGFAHYEKESYYLPIAYAAWGLRIYEIIRSKLNSCLQN
jgi:hypothetical protein